MRKVTQVSDNDCLSASIASLLDLPLAVVPVWHGRGRGGDGQRRQAQRWLAKLGWNLIEIPVNPKAKIWPWCSVSIATPCILGVKSTKQYGHAVVGTFKDGGCRVVFDPAPEHLRLDEYIITSVIFLIPAIPPGTALENLRLLKS